MNTQIYRRRKLPGVRSFEAAFEAGARTVDAAIVETVLSRRIDDLEPQLVRHGYDVRALCDQFDAKPAEIRQLLRAGLNPQRPADRGNACHWSSGLSRISEPASGVS